MEILFETEKELCTQIPCVFRTVPVVEKTIYSLKLPAVKKGDIAKIYWDSELTNPYQYNAMACAALHLASSALAAEILELVKRPNGENITKDGHHWTGASGSKGYRFKNDYPNGVYLNLVAYSAASGSVGNQYLQVEQGYGYLQAILNQ